MTITITELQDSREFSTTDGFKASRKFLAYDDEGIPASAKDIIDASGMPLVGDGHPDFVQLVADTYTATPSTSRAGVWEVVWNYVIPTGDIVDTGEEVIPLDMRATVKAFDMYRKNPNLPANINSPGISDDIGGTLVSISGKPVSLWIPTASIRITEEITAGSFNAAYLLNSTGKRNYRPFLGLNAGSVVFHGADLSRKSLYTYNIVYSFEWDPVFHLRQEPEMDQQGKPVRNLDDTDMEVYWRQPYPNTVDFGFVGGI